MLPRVLHSLEPTTVPNAEINKMEDFQSSMLQKFQNLPPGASNLANYLLSGTLLLQGEIEKRLLAADRKPSLRYTEDYNQS